MRLFRFVLAAYCIVLATLALALTPGQRVVLFGGCPSQAQQFFNRAPGALANKANYCRLIAGLVNAGIWQQLDVLYIFAAPTQGVALTNLVSSSFGATAVNSPTFTAYRGFTGNGTTSYVNSNYNPKTSGVNYTLNSAHVSQWIRSAIAGQHTTSAGSYDGTEATALVPYYDTSNGGFFQINDTGSISYPLSISSYASGLFLVNRTSSSAIATYNNGNTLGSGTKASTAIPGFSIFIGAQNNSGTAGNFSTWQFSQFSAGASFSSTQRATYLSVLQTYLHAVGAV